MPSIPFFGSLLVLTLVSSGACIASSQSHELYTRLNTADEKWIPLPHDPQVWHGGLPIYHAYDSGSIGQKSGISYVRAKYGDKYSAASIYVLAAHCKRKRMVHLALGSKEANAAVSPTLWNNGKIRFSNPYDGGDYTIWSIPSDLPDVDKLFEAICVPKPAHSH